MLLPTRLLVLLCLPGGFLGCLLAFNSINPMSIAFKTEFWVTNQSRESISVTPIGAIGKAGRRSTLPLLADREGYWLLPSTTGLVIQPGETHKFIYDWDDIQFSELIVEAAGERRLLVVDPEPTVNQYRQPSDTAFTVEAPAALPLAPPEIAALADQRLSWWWAYVAVSTVVMVIAFVVRGWKLLRRDTT